MENYLSVLQNSALFCGIPPEEIEPLCRWMDAEQRRVSKNERILAAGQPVTALGMVLAGRIQIVQDDYWGNRSILAHVGPGELFAEAFVCAQAADMPVSVEAVEESELLLFAYDKIMADASPAHHQFLRNMLQILANKNLTLTKKIEVLSQRSIREKLLSYLSAQAKRAGSDTFTIPFDRQGLADYLSADRSALSSVLSKLKQEEILTFHKNQFTILNGGEKG